MVIESTDAGCASTLFSLASAAAVTCGIMNPEFRPAPPARNGGSPSFNDGFTRRSMRRSEMPASALSAMARKSSANAIGSPWKLPPEMISPLVPFASFVPGCLGATNTSGLSTAEFISISNTRRQ